MAHPISGVMSLADRPRKAMISGLVTVYGICSVGKNVRLFLVFVFLSERYAHISNSHHAPHRYFDLAGHIHKRLVEQCTLDVQSPRTEKHFILLTMVILTHNRGAVLVDGRNRLGVEPGSREGDPTFVVGATLIVHRWVPSNATTPRASGRALWANIDKGNPTRVHWGTFFEWPFNRICVYIRIKGPELAYPLLHSLRTASETALLYRGGVTLACAR
jgi:hypothetical protein